MGRYLGGNSVTSWKIKLLFVNTVSLLLSPQSKIRIIIFNSMYMCGKHSLINLPIKVLTSAEIFLHLKLFSLDFICLCFYFLPDYKSVFSIFNLFLVKNN